MTAIEVTPLPNPSSVDDPAYPAYERYIAIGNASRARILGTNLLDLVAPNMVALLQDQTWQQHQLFLAREDGEIAGGATLIHAGKEHTPVCWLSVTVHPDLRRRGIGTALADHVERLAVAQGYTIFQAQVTHTTTPGGPRLASATGAGDLPANDAGARFLTRRGYRLEQVNRMSFLRLPVAPETLAQYRSEATAHAGAEYRVHAWPAPTPDRWVDDLALLSGRMFTDAPTAAMQFDTTPWDAARVRAEEEAVMGSGWLPLLAAVEHVPSGHLVAFNELMVPNNRARLVRQGATLVLKEHRGRRLGMLVKVANIQELARVSPASPVIQTVNAEENRHMLAVNEAVGFVPIGFMGMWQRVERGRS
jgi:GNAT superfamily N-acetyltransferase